MKKGDAGKLNAGAQRRLIGVVYCRYLRLGRGTQQAKKQHRIVCWVDEAERCVAGIRLEKALCQEEKYRK